MRAQAHRKTFRSFIVNNQTVGLVLASLSVATVGASAAAHAPMLPAPSPASLMLWVAAVVALTVRLATAD
jgi:hypothetical protein